MERTYAVLIVFALAASASGTAHARHGAYSRSHYHHRSTYYATADVPRDSQGRIRRSKAARSAFEYEHPCPSTGRAHGACPGYVVDHVVALKRGGPDEPSNMQWQTTQDAKAKDRVE